jgi:hypothetical protein
MMWLCRAGDGQQGFSKASMDGNTQPSTSQEVVLKNIFLGEYRMATANCKHVCSSNK